MIIVDASAVVAVLFDELTRDQILHRLEGSVLAAPTILPFEIANSCLKKIKRHPEARELWVQSFATLEEWDIELLPVDHGGTVLLAEKHNLSAYDASYLWLALEVDAELVTLDTKLHRAYAALARS